MNSSLILPSSLTTLNPLLSGNETGNTPVMGIPISSHIKSYLCEYGISCSSTISNSDGCVLVESNLITNTDLSAVIQAHTLNHPDITAVLRPITEKSMGNIVISNPMGYITEISDTGYRFDPSFHETEGIYILSPNAYNLLKDNSININGTELLRAALKSNMNILGYISDAHSISITNIEDYKQCHSDILNKKLRVKLNAKEVKEGFWLESDVKIENDVSIETPVYISADCCIERGSKIEGNTYVGSGTTIKSSASLSHCIVGNGCNISVNATVQGGILADNVSLGASSKVLENAVVGGGCRIESDCTISTGVKIWPNKRIMQGTRLSDNLVWGSVGTEHLFRNGKICGEINIEVTPEFMTKLGAAYGTMFNNKSVGLSFDSSPVCSVLANALSAGITSSGALLYNFKEQTLPITRRCVRYYNLDSALHINIAGGKGFFYPEIEFIEADGSSFNSENESIIENIFFNNVFFRADVKNLKEPIILSDSKLHYTQDILNSLKSKYYSINMEIRTRSESVSEILEVLLGTIEKRATANAIKQFSADIADNGQDIILYTTSGQLVDTNKLLGIIAVILIKRFDYDYVVMPISVSERLEEYITDLGANIIYSGVSEHAFMKKIIRHNLKEQSMLCFDGVYLAITLLDYLNETGISFDELLSSLPDTSHAELEIECSNTRKADIIKQLHDKYQKNKIDTTDGIKIYKSNGWVLVIPEKYRHSIKIITEGTNMEAAEEMCNIFANQIKKLAKPE